MKLYISKEDPFGVKDQIKRQIRVLVASGEFVPGQPLPSAKDMATLLNVNRNTVSQAYKELASEGLLEIIVGSGTYVKEGKMLEQTSDLKEILSDSVEKAKALGFSLEQISDFFLTHLSLYGTSPTGRRVLVIDCNEGTVGDISNAIRKELEVETEGVLIQTLEQNPDKISQYLEEKDLVVCGFNHLEEFRKLVPEPPVDAVGVLLNTDLRIMNEIMQLPPNTRIGLTCESQRSTESWCKNIFLSRGSTITKIHAGLDNPSGLKEMLDQCDLIYASKYVYERIRKLAKPGKKVIEVDITIDPASIDLIRERLKNQ
jgi:DNA-binding transcriptional regulator YhcF (GntR family)